MCRQFVFLAVVALAGCVGPQPRPLDVQPSPSPAESKADLFARKRACMELGERHAEADGKGMGNGVVLVAPQYCYSEDHNTCLYSFGYMAPKFQSYLVQDLMTNETLANYGEANGKPYDWSPSLDAYNKHRKELLATCK